MKKNPFFTILFAIFSLVIGKGQEKSIVPVSPEAAALTKMVNYPVNLYTGIPDISIPLYEIKVGELVLPITLQYHAGGFKVNEKATRVGLGWSLSCDLQVMREINGIDDFAHNGYANNAKMTSNPYLFYNTEHPFTAWDTYEIAHGDMDGLPDKFYYKLLDKSGSFFILKNASGTGNSFVPVPYDDIKIEFQEPNFIITDTDGTKYYFGEGAINGSGKEFTGVQGDAGRITGWKCMKIENSIGRTEFTFSYSSISEKNYARSDFIEYYSAYYYNQNSFGEYYRSDEYPLSGQTDFNSFFQSLFRVSNPKYIHTIASRILPMLHVPYYDEENDSFIDCELNYTTHDYPLASPALYVSGLTLQQIDFRGGEVKFHGTSQLSAIEVKDKSFQTVKSFQFYQSYETPVYMSDTETYNGPNFQGTLYLDSLMMGIPSQPYETYRFLYHNKFCFGNHLIGHDAWKYPNPSTREIGHWQQSTILPPVTWPETHYFSALNYNDKVDNVPLTTAGSEWALASHEESMKNGVLKRIVYPTGGFVDFDFEANRYPVQFLVDYSVYDPPYISVFPQFCGGLRIRSINFYENGATSIAGATTHKYYKYGKNENGMGDLVYSPRVDTSDGSYNLAPVTTSQFVANVKWRCDGFEPCDNRSKLILLSLERKKMLYPASAMDYSYGSGVFVYYTDVTEYDMELGVHAGKTVYSYYSPKDFYVNFWESYSHIPGTIIPYIKTGVYNGAQKSVSRYRFTPRGKYELARETTYEYEKYERQPKIQAAYSNFNIIYQLQDVGSMPDYGFYDNNYQSPVDGIIDYYQDIADDFIYGTYTIPVEKLLVKRQKEELYDSLGNVTATETFFDYDTRCRLVSSRLTNSKGDEVTTSFKYPYNFSGVYTAMTNRNIVGTVIEEQEHVNGSKTRTIRNNYKTVTGMGNDFIVPSSIETAQRNNPLRVEVSFDEYDQYGNILQLTGKDGEPVSYLWGYWGLHPVAEVRGAGYALIPSRFKSNAGINVPGSDASLRNILTDLRTSFTGSTQVTGYTHKWLTGVSSRVDAGGAVTYYEYDPYGRLVAVKDDAGKTIQSHAYNMPEPAHPAFLWNWNKSIPQLLSVTRECPAGNKQSYSVILPGGEGGWAVTTESANWHVRENYYQGQIEGVSFPPSCNEQHVKVELRGFYDTWENPFFSNSCTVDFLQNGAVAYSVVMPFNDINDFETPFQSAELYILPGTYQVSMRPYPGTLYANGNIPIYGCRAGYNNPLIFNSTDASLTFNPGTDYEVYMVGTYAWGVTHIQDLR